MALQEAAKRAAAEFHVSNDDLTKLIAEFLREMGELFSAFLEHDACEMFVRLTMTFFTRRRSTTGWHSAEPDPNIRHVRPKRHREGKSSYIFSKEWTC
jgi:hypothetical protein